MNVKTVSDLARIRAGIGCKAENAACAETLPLAA
jgi:hypothetical protein